GDFGGAAFVFMVRYFVPSLLLGLLLLGKWLADVATHWRRLVVGIMLVLIGVNLTTSFKYESAAWPKGEWVPGVLVVLAAVACVAAIVGLASRAPNMLPVAIGVVALLLAGGGWFLQRHYLDHRYVHAGLPQDVEVAYFQHVDDAKIAVLGTEHFY